MKRKQCLAVCLLCVIILTGCGSGEREAGSGPEGAENAVSSRSDLETRQGREAIPLELPQGEVPERTVVEYTWDHPVTVDGGRQLTIRLFCQAEYQYNSWGYSVKDIEVLEGNALLQSISIEEADTAALVQEGIDPDYAQAQTHCWEPDGSLHLNDLNFDGHPDLRLLEGTGVVNSRYLCWLWDPDSQTFRFAFSLVGYDVQIDAEEKQIITTARDSMTHITSYYTYDETGTLQLVDRDSVTPEMG